MPERDQEAKIHYKKALSILLEGEKGEPHGDAVTEELPAIISHWLRDRGNPPLILPQGIEKKWTASLELAAAEGSQPRPVAIDYSGLKAYPHASGFDFIDLFAGVGGFHQALSSAGGRCVFSSEWEPHAKETYFENYGMTPFGDITRFTGDSGVEPMFKGSIPPHSVLAAGFPCQAFSQAGRGLGFQDARGTLFFEVLKIARLMKPEILILENVKRLKTHDGGMTFKVIVNSLKEVGYKVYAKVLRARDFGLPQNRERIFIVAFSSAVHFEFPEPPKDATIKCLGDILEKNVDDSYTLSDKLFQGHVRRREENSKKGKGFGFSVFAPSAKYTNTLSARYWKDGSEILVEQTGKNPRMLTPRECARLQGFPESFVPNKSKRYAYQQFGNSVPVNVVRAVVNAAIKANIDRVPPPDLVDPYIPVV